MRIVRRWSVALLLVPLAADGQAVAQSGWAPWYGCWAPVGSAGTDAPMTCVVPAAESAESAVAADFVTVREGQELQRVSLRADGTRSAIDAVGCTGWESASFSADGARVYVRGEITCADGPTQTTSAIFALTEGADWLDVSAVRTGDERSVRVTRNVFLPWYEMPSALREALAARERSAAGARAAAAIPLRHSQVIDAAGAADEYAVEAWMVEAARDARTPLVTRRRELEAFAEAGVPGRLIDMAIVLANPRAFRVELSSQASAPTSYGSGVASSAMGRCDRSLEAAGGRATGWLLERDYYPGAWPGYSDCFAYGPYSPYSPFYRYGYFGHGTAFAGYYGQVPVQVVVVPVGPTASGGRVVKGRGYSSGGSNSGSTANPRSNAGAARTSPAPTSSQGSTASSGGSSSSSGTAGSAAGGGRTAKPRTP